MAIELDDGTIVRSLPEQVDYLTTKNEENEIAIDNLSARLEAAIAGVLHYKGSVATYDDLPADAEVGDVYNVIDTGSNYAWTGEEWDELGSSVDLSNYVDKTSKQAITGSKSFINGLYIGDEDDTQNCVYLSYSADELELTSDSSGSIILGGDKIYSNSVYTKSLGTSSHKFDEAWLSTALNLGSSGILKYENGAFTVNDDLLPAVTASYDLGGSSNQWKDLYLSGVIDFGNNAKIQKDGSNRVNILFNNNVKVKVGQNETYFLNHVDPDANNTYDLGRSGVAWRNIYLTGKISDGTNEVTVADLKALIDYAKAQGWIS